jgi:hypothetical protein
MQRIYILIISVLAVGALAAYLTFERSPDTDVRTVETTRALTRMTAIGPVGKGVTYTEQIGRHGFTLQAERINLKTTKILGFDNNLVKKMVATGVMITITQGDQKRLTVHKDRIEMSPNMKTITIDHPTILFPSTLAAPDKLRIDKSGQTITLYYKNKQDVWRLQ